MQAQDVGVQVVHEERFQIWQCSEEFSIMFSSPGNSSKYPGLLNLKCSYRLEDCTKVLLSHSLGHPSHKSKSLLCILSVHHEEQTKDTFNKSV